MDKLEQSINPKAWGTLNTKFTPDSDQVSVTDFTDGTVNIDTDFNGNLTKRSGYVRYNSNSLNSIPKDQFEGVFSDGSHHLLVVSGGEVEYTSGDGVINNVQNGTGFSAGANFEFALTQDRIYGGNGVNSPIVYDRATSYGGVSYTAPRIKNMGAQAPSSAPTAGAPTAGGSVPNGAHTYKVTYLYYDFEESNGSAASGVQTAGAGNNTIPLTAIPIGGYGVTARKIYRDNNDGVWLHLTTISDNTTTTFNDTLLAGTTPTPIPDDNGTPPSFSLVTLWVDRLFVSGVPGDPSTLFYSEASQPDVFTTSAQILCNQEDPVTGLVVYFDRLIVFNRRSMGQILGKTSDTFRYAAIPSSVGCVDNRTIQIRVIEGVPVLIWLSDRGFYAYDGNSINYISETIEDLVNFNIQQAIQQKNSNTQSTQAQFQGGTSSNGIDLLSIPGTITTRGYSSGTSAVGTNPRRNWDDTGDWDGGTVKTNLVIDVDNTIHTPIRYAPDLTTQGQLTAPAIISSGNLTLSSYNGEDNTAATSSPFSSASAGNPSITSRVAQRIVPSQDGTIDLLKIRASSNTATNHITLALHTDSLGVPGTALFTSGSLLVNQTTSTVLSAVCSVAVTAGTAYWIVSTTTGPTGTTSYYGNLTGFFFNGVVDNTAMKTFVQNNSPQWGILGGYGYPAVHASFSIGYHINYSQTGSWASDIYDSESDTITATLNIAHSGTLPALSSSVTTVEGSDDSLFASGPEVSEDVNNLTTNQNLSIFGKRYWRIRIVLSTTSSDAIPVIGSPTLKFATTSVWESESIDTTTDSTVYNSLVTTSSVPAGTSATTLIATSASAAGPWTGSGNADGQFGAFGSHIVRRYVRIRVTVTSNAANDTSASVSSVVLKWTLVANLQSSAIDTAATPPAGFDLFLSDYTTDSGTVVFQMRSGVSLVALAAATYATVVPGDFPTTTPLQYVQWKVIITSSDEDVPEVDSVTVQWFISSDSSVRPASIFVDGRYYVALAELEQTTNNILLEFDLNGKWRRHDNLFIATLSYFFNRPYFGSATASNIYKFLSGTTDNGTNIVFDYRSKALDYSTSDASDNVDKVKVVGEMLLNGKNTGATFYVSYSVDQGVNFYPMLTNSGASSFTTTSDNTEFFYRLRPDWNSGNPISGRTVMYRILNQDAFMAEIRGYKVKSLVRKQPPVITG